MKKNKLPNLPTVSIEQDEESFFGNKVRSSFVIVAQKFLKHKMARIGLIVFGIFVLAALFAPLICKYDPYTIDLTLVPNGIPLPPSWEHPFGTDQLGRDYFARCLYGARVSIVVGVASVLLSIAIGLPIGLLAGYFGGIFDNAVCRFIEFLMCLPVFFLMVSINAMLGTRSIATIIIVIASFSWMGSAKVMRGQVMQAKALDYTKAAKALGLKNSSIMFKHLLPNTIMPLIVTATMGIATAIIMESGLSFLGMGVVDPTPSWGSMIMSSRQYLMSAPHMGLIPGFLMCFLIISVNFIGDGLRDAIDPKNA